MELETLFSSSIELIILFLEILSLLITTLLTLLNVNKVNIITNKSSIKNINFRLYRIQK